MFKKLTMLLMYISLILVLIGCRESHKGIINSQLEVSHEPRSIKKIAVLSFNKVHLRSLDLPQIKNRIIDSMSEQIDSRIIKSISFKNPEIIIIEPAVLLNKIHNSRFASDLNDFVETYYNSGIINKKILDDISSILGADALLFGELTKVYQSDGNGWNTTGTTIVTVIYSILEVSTAMTIWELTADGIVKRQMDVEAPPISEAVDLAIDKITQNVPRL